MVPETSHIAKPAASWLDDFLVWISPEAFACCRKFTNGTFCPPDDQVFIICFVQYLLWLESLALPTILSETALYFIFHFSGFDILFMHLFFELVNSSMFLRISSYSYE